MPEPEQKQEEKQQDDKDEVIDQIGKICEENKMPVAIFLSISEDGPPRMWFKGNMVTAGEIAAKFVRLVKEDMLRRLEI